MLKFVGLTSLFVVALVTLTLALTWLAYRMTWRGHQRWMEATRHQRKLAMAVGRWIWFKWAHIDCEYWVVHVDFRAGPIELRGRPPAGSYWSFTYNTWSEVNPSINTENVNLEDDGNFRITFSQDPSPGNWIPVRRSAQKGVIYFRIYESPDRFPSELPEVTQNGALVVKRTLS